MTRDAKSKRARRGRTRREAQSSLPAAPAVRAGMSGGTYRPLSEHEVQRIHSTALDVLENIGIGEPFAALLELMLPAGCVLGDDNRLKFPRALIEDILASVPRKIVRYAPDPTYDLQSEGASVHLSSGGEMVSILDYATQGYRPATLVDLYDAARLGDQLEHLHLFGQPFIASEYSARPYEHDVNVAYAALAGTRKPFSVGLSVVDNLDPVIALFDSYLGTEGAFVERPFCTFGGCPIVSPLRFAQDNAEVLIRCAQLGFNYDVACASQAGATAPAALAGALVQTFAETLACLAIVNLIRPGTSMPFGMWPCVSDLRTGAFSGGSGEFALINAATAQICNYYGLVSSIATGMTDSKTMDAQAGYEKALTTVAAVLAGGNDVCAYPGSVGSLIGFSFEGMLIDNDMMGSALRMLRGIEVDDDTLSYKVIEDAVYGPGHYLGHEQTLRLMKTEYLYPEVADRRNPTEWMQSGRQTVYARAHERVVALLADYYPQYIEPARDRAIRERFPIALDPTEMSPAGGRW